MGREPIKMEPKAAAEQKTPTAQQAAEAVNILVQYAAMAPLPENAHVQKNIAGQILREYIAAAEAGKAKQPENVTD